MRYRKLDDNGDYTLGTNQDFWENSPEAVAQAVKTRLALFRGEWALDTDDGTPWNTDILGKSLAAGRDAVLRARILGTPGVQQISAFASTFNPDSRQYSVSATIDTIYGQATISEVL